MKIKDLFEKKNEIKNHFENIDFFDFGDVSFIDFGDCGYSSKEIKKLLQHVKNTLIEIAKNKITFKFLCVEIGNLRFFIESGKNGKLEILDPQFESTKYPTLKIKNVNEGLFSELSGDVNGFTFKETKHAGSQFDERELGRKDRRFAAEIVENLTKKVNFVFDNPNFSLNFMNGFCYSKKINLGFGFALNKRPKQIIVTTFMPHSRNNFKDDNIYFEV